MGKVSGILGFFLSCDTPYLAGKLKGQNSKDRESDYSKLRDDLLKSILTQRKEGRLQAYEAREYYDEAVQCDFELEDPYHDSEAYDLLAKFLGQDWYMEVPTKTTGEHEYLHRIIDAVKLGLAQWQAEQSNKQHPVEVLRGMAGVVAQSQGLEVDHASFDKVKAETDKPHPLTKKAAEDWRSPD
jgi:hypothetical protein